MTKPVGQTKKHNEMLEEIEKQRSLIAMTEMRKNKIIFGHIIRRNNFIRHILGKRYSGSERKRSPRRKLVGCRSYQQMILDNSRVFFTVA